MHEVPERKSLLSKDIWSCWVVCMGNYLGRVVILGNERPYHFPSPTNLGRIVLQY